MFETTEQTIGFDQTISNSNLDFIWCLLHLDKGVAHRCVWSLIKNKEWDAHSLVCQISYLDITWFSQPWQNCALEYWMIFWSRVWHSMITFNGKKMKHKFWYLKILFFIYLDESKILDGQTWNEQMSWNK